MNQPEDDITQADTSKVPAVAPTAIPTERYGNQSGQLVYPTVQEQMNIETGQFIEEIAPPRSVYPGAFVPQPSYAPSTPPPYYHPSPANPLPSPPAHPVASVAPAPTSPQFGEHNAPTLATPSQFYAGVGTMSASMTGNAGNMGSMPPKSRKQRRWPKVAAIIIILLIVLIPGSVAAFYTFAYPATAVVTITPADNLEQHTFTILEMTGNANAAQQQVAGARMLIASQSQTQSGTATGQGHTNGIAATGSLTLENDTSNYYYVTKVGGVVTSKSGATVVCDQVITVYPGQKGTFQAHVATPGSAGNIAAYDVSITQSDSAGTIKLYNTQAFSGGQDAGTYTVVQQSDINTTASSMESSLQQRAQSALQGQLQASEKLVATPNCTTKVTSDKGVGAVVSSFNVTVTETCSGEAYNPVPAQAMATNMLQTQATSSLNSRYVLAGNVTTTIAQVNVSDAKHNTLSLTIAASGHWAYSFNTSQQQALAKLIGGKSQQDARALLTQQTGVSNAVITLSGTFLFWNALPTNIDHITIKVN